MIELKSFTPISPTPDCPVAVVGQNRARAITAYQEGIVVDYDDGRSLFMRCDGGGIVAEQVKSKWVSSGKKK